MSIAGDLAAKPCVYQHRGPIEPSAGIPRLRAATAAFPCGAPLSMNRVRKLSKINATIDRFMVTMRARFCGVGTANEPLPNTVILNGAARNEPRSEEPRGMSQRRPVLAEDLFGTHGILRLRVAPAFAHGDTPLRMTAIWFIPAKK